MKNEFNNLFYCFSNINNLLISFLFPQFMFGKIYEISRFGEYFVGSCSIISINFIVYSLISIILINKYFIIFDYSYIYFSNCGNITNIEICKKFNYTKFFENNCIFNGTFVCECVKNNFIEKCHYEKRININDFYNFTFYIIYFTLFLNILINGYFYSYYRKIIKNKFNIFSNNIFDNYLHFIPFINELALLQEYNTIKRLENKNDYLYL